MILRSEIEKTASLEEAVKKTFGLKVNITERTCILTKEKMEGEVAEAYDEIGRKARWVTYNNMALDFRNRTQCYGLRRDIGTVIDIGCGSGLLSFELADTTNGYIIGIDLSQDMIRLAKENLDYKSKERIEEIVQYQARLPEACKQKKETIEKLKNRGPFYNSLEFREGSVYNICQITQDKKNINYIVCRNALHRFQDPKRAIEQMYRTLSPGGKIYIRDLKRDADWQIILDRMSEKRWEHPYLILDNIGAMAGMLTKDELEQILKECRIRNYKITDGSYELNDEITPKENQLKEYASIVEYVCVIEKTK